MRRSNLSTLLYLLLVFVSGSVVGGFANRLYMLKTTVNAATAPRSHEEFRKHYLDMMQSRLHLNESQVTQLKQIMDTTDDHFRELHKTIEGEHFQKVEAMLDDTQKAEYAKMRQERELKRKQHEQKGL
jgi:hypothetical protein